MGFLQKYFHKYGAMFSLGVAFLVLEATCDLMQPAIMSKIIDVGVAGRNLDFVISRGILMLLITGLGASAAVIRNIVSNNVSQRFGAELRYDLFAKIQSFAFENLNRFETASLITRLTNDVTQLQNFVNGLMRVFVKAPLLCIGSIIMATLLNRWLAMVVFGVVPCVGVLMVVSIKMGYPFFRKVQKRLDGVNTVTREYLTSVRVVKAFNRFDFETNRFATVNQDLAEASSAATRLMAVFTPTISLTVNCGIIAVLWLGGVHVARGDLQVGQVIAFVNYMTQILASLMLISMVFNMFVRARASAERIGEVMEQENTMPVPLNPLEPSGVPGQVELEQVHFAYSPVGGDPVLQDITFTAAPGEMIGMIGATGSGKSSLVNLIPRFYDPIAGTVKVNGVNVKAMDPLRLRQAIAVVPQKTTLFSGSIRDNIRWGKADATPQEVERAAKVAQAHSFIAAFPNGYDTILGQGGVNLSGGQKQRIAIARALIRHPEILILDDSTSAIDMATEAQLRQAIKGFLKATTCFLITQRIVSAMGTDRIIVLDNGKIAGIGTHDELLESCGVYQEIYRSQIGKGDI